jgi:hypothetical protein
VGPVVRVLTGVGDDTGEVEVADEAELCAELVVDVVAAPAGKLGGASVELGLGDLRAEVGDADVLTGPSYAQAWTRLERPPPVGPTTMAAARRCR